ELLIDRERAELLRLRQPAVTGGREAEGRGILRPGQRNPAAVAPGHTGTQVGGVLPQLVGDVADLGQPELLTRVEIGRSGQRQHLSLPGSGPAPTESGIGHVVPGETIAEAVVRIEAVAAGMTDHVVV